MHLLATRPGSVEAEGEAVELGQSPGDIVILSTADSELGRFALARRGLGAGFPTVRLAPIQQLSHPLSVDLYVERVVAKARLVIVRLLGGTGYWRYGLEQIEQCCRTRGIKLVALPGCERADPELAALSTEPSEACERLWRFALEGGPDNARNFLAYAASLIGHEAAWSEPLVLPQAGIYREPVGTDGPVAALVFYRSLMLSGNLAPIDAMIEALAGRGIATLALYVASLKDAESAALVSARIPGIDIVLNATAFAASSPGAFDQPRTPSPLEVAGRPILQLVLARGSEQAWRDGSRGLGPSDLAMNVAVPEIDGRILAGAISFKDEAEYDAATECAILVQRPVPDRVAHAADLAAAWCRLGRTPPGERRVAILLANYSGRDGRNGSAVGLDTAASLTAILGAMRTAGYDVGEEEFDLADPAGVVSFPLQAYRAALPPEIAGEIGARWGEPETDPAAADGAFQLRVLRRGNLAIAIQPPRIHPGGDDKASYHDGTLAPSHGYAAFYLWLRHGFDAHAVLHLGTHGTLEWLPGKALALSASCHPAALLGPLPHLYPFIANNPGEGTQAKRRSAAVIVSHLTPPLARAESYGPLRDLEQLVDEYFDASGVDPRRLALLRDQILDLASRTGLDRDCGILGGDAPDVALGKLDNHLCDIKDLQIRSGLHVFGRSPTGRQETELLVALTRVPRGTGQGRDASLLRALATDLGQEGDPLEAGDDVLEALAVELVEGRDPEPHWAATRLVLDEIRERVRPALIRSGPAELTGLLAGLDGCFVEPGPSGAPTRGRLDVLPTGRNFYSVDTRTVPTPAAWLLGWRSAAELVERYRQDHGEWPRSVAMGVWGTANMRTGGDDLAQALALIGARPTWDSASRRVTGFEILPLSVLDRPRVDVTLRISGLFRDAFPGQIELFDAAARAVARLDEAADMNPLVAAGEGFRIFGARPGHYGSGLDGSMAASALAERFTRWGSHGYGVREGAAEQSLRTRLANTQMVVQAQDNAEHDLLDSDAYWQFEGGLAAAVTELSGQRPASYHLDHSRPDRPKIRSLEQEIARVVRGRAVNPKWIGGMRAHGYRGAAEMAATVEYMVGFAAATGAVADQHFDAIYDAYIEDRETWDFLTGNNRGAAREIAERLLAARGDGLWRPRANSAPGRLEQRLEELA